MTQDFRFKFQRNGMKIFPSLHRLRRRQSSFESEKFFRTYFFPPFFILPAPHFSFIICGLCSAEKSLWIFLKTNKEFSSRKIDASNDLQWQTTKRTFICWSVSPTAFSKFIISMTSKFYTLTCNIKIAIDTKLCGFRLITVEGYFADKAPSGTMALNAKSFFECNSFRIPEWFSCKITKKQEQSVIRQVKGLRNGK